MNLDEAIKHCEEKSCGNTECNQEHQQLAEWLKELKQFKEGYIVADLRDVEVKITNSNLSVINANKSMQFDCPNCKHNQIEKAWNYTHNYCPHCGAKITWDLKE